MNFCQPCFWMASNYQAVVGSTPCYWWGPCKIMWWHSRINDIWAWDVPLNTYGQKKDEDGSGGANWLQSKQERSSQIQKLRIKRDDLIPGWDARYKSDCRNGKGDGILEQLMAGFIISSASKLPETLDIWNRRGVLSIVLGSWKNKVIQRRQNFKHDTRKSDSLLRCMEWHWLSCLRH